MRGTFHLVATTDLPWLLAVFGPTFATRGPEPRRLAEWGLDEERKRFGGAGRRQLMGRFAADVQTRLRERLATLAPGFDWTTEYRVGRTPVDVAGESAAHLVLVELEWRRADPADNTAKLFRHLTEDTLAGRIDVFQLFTRYYDLASGGISSKRANAEFVGRTAAATFDSVRYFPVEFGLDPPKRGAERPDGWRSVTDATAREILARL